MSGIFKFDAKKLDGLLAKYGVKNTWLHLLATNLNNKKEFQYILKNDEFKKAKILPTNLLEGLSIGEVSIHYE